MPGFDDHVIGVYARGMTMRECQAHLLELYGTKVSPDQISTITDEVMDVAQWQHRPLETMYPIVYFDALYLKIRDEGTVKNKAVYQHWHSRSCSSFRSDSRTNPKLHWGLRRDVDRSSSVYVEYFSVYLGR